MRILAAPYGRGHAGRRPPLNPRTWHDCVVSTNDKTSTVALIPPRDAIRIENARGSLAFWQASAHVYATQARGYMTSDMARLIIERGELLYRTAGPVRSFHDWFDMSNYDSACRMELTAWVMRHRERSKLHIGLRSRMVAMGVAVANLALGNLITIHNQPAALKSALAAAS
jgi:hypothetical protein